MTFLSNLLLGSLKLDLSDLVPEPVLVVVDLCRVLIDIHVHDLDLPALVLSPICLVVLDIVLGFFHALFKKLVRLIVRVLDAEFLGFEALDADG